MPILSRLHQFRSQSLLIIARLERLVSGAAVWIGRSLSMMKVENSFPFPFVN
jgi:hypothetical protein